MKYECLKCHQFNDIPNGHHFNVCSFCGAVQAKLIAAVEARAAAPTVREPQPIPSEPVAQLQHTVTRSRSPTLIATVAWLLTALCACGAAFFTVTDLMRAQSAPQQAAIAAIGCAMVVIPYVLARAIDRITQR